MTNSRIEVELRLWGFASSVEETLRAIEGSRIWQAGDLRAGSSVLRYQDSLWSLDSRCEASAPLSQHVDDICSRLASHWDAIKSIALASRAELSVAIYCDKGVQPSLDLKPEQVRLLGEMGAAVDLDLYRLP